LTIDTFSRAPAEADSPAGVSLLDAYAHVGEPRFGSAPDALAMLRAHGAREAVLVLGPGIPDLAALARAATLWGESVRLMGIPFGATEEQRIELAQAQIALGISGMRLMPFEVGPNAPVLRMLGERGLWLYAINPYEDETVTRLLLEWLTDFPEGRVASPHFLRPGGIDDVSASVPLMRRLTDHPRFHAILSRQGGVGSTQAYPHQDLRPWVTDCVGRLGWDRMLWGSEYPVLYWRNEEYRECATWVDALGITVSRQQREAFLHDNAERLLFSSPAPRTGPLAIPEWVQAQYNRAATVPLFPPNPMQIPMESYAPVLAGFVRKRLQGDTRRFADYWDAHADTAVR
jgi:hypothetical protein